MVITVAWRMAGGSVVYLCYFSRKVGTPSGTPSGTGTRTRLLHALRKAARFMIEQPLAGSSFTLPAAYGDRGAFSLLGSQGQMMRIQDDIHARTGMRVYMQRLDGGIARGYGVKLRLMVRTRRDHVPPASGSALRSSRLPPSVDPVDGARRSASGGAGTDGLAN